VKKIKKMLIAVLLLGIALGERVVAVKQADMMVEITVPLGDLKFEVEERSLAVFRCLEEAQNLEELESRIKNILLTTDSQRNDWDRAVCNIKTLNYDPALMKVFFERLVAYGVYGSKEEIYLCMVRLGWVQAVDVLIKMLEVNVYYTDNQGRNALQIAQRIGHQGMVERLALEGGGFAPSLHTLGLSAVDEVEPGQPAQGSGRPAGTPGCSSGCLLL
jgi:hypothetical protein